MIRRPPRSTQGVSSAASDVYKRQVSTQSTWDIKEDMKKESQWISNEIVKKSKELMGFEEGYTIEEIAGSSVSNETIMNEYKALLAITDTDAHDERLICVPKSNSDFSSLNRYGDVLPYDDNIVEVGPRQVNFEKWYQNCSFVHSWLGEDKRILASQGPPVSTFPQFWKGVWMFNVSHIFMFCKLVESGMTKCNQYWPKVLGAKMNYGPEIAVIFLSEETAKSENLLIRTLELCYVPTGEKRQVVQYHYLGWPDHGLPKDTTPISEMLAKIIEAMSPSSENRILMHCSAGIGRTGTFLALAHLMSKIGPDTPKTTRISVFHVVRLLREQRMSMVERSAQYQFIYEYIRTAIKLH
eukprot:TRINITY_DN589_c0_g1_i2.p1 TRINITY_DN589_c0_g1~~TRINITY_DN589_c0_g1_i2.p1  ORF type:complete len:354 (-),score=64.84 TRINITY_DN589_c0_g1_i2:66-1127(-)